MTDTSQQTLQIKSYFAGTVEAALERASRELGPDALLMNTREAAPEARHLGAYEVVFGVVPPPPRRMPRSLSPRRGSAARLAARARLVAAGLGLDLTTGILAAAEEQRAQNPDGNAREHLAAALESRLAIDPDLALTGETASVVAFVGPPGAGKTTTLVKLAITYGLRARRSVELISIDTCRIAGAAQLQTYAAILGAGFQAADTAQALSQAVAAHRTGGLILIDTSGYSASNLGSAGELAEYLAGHPEIQTHLVLPASMKPGDLSRTADRFEIFRPSRLIFTKLDETDSYGSIFAEAARTRKPISFLTTGPVIPDDFEAATKARIVELILTEPARRTRSAA